MTLGETNPTGKEVWALVDTRVQKWNMSVEGWEEVVLDVNIAGLLRATVREHFENVPEDNVELDLELVDIAVERCDTFVSVFFCSFEDGSSAAAPAIWSSSFLMPDQKT